MQFTILIAFTAVALVVIIAACPEHGNYQRAAIYDIDVAKPRAPPTDQKEPTEHQEIEVPSPTAPESADKKKTYLQELNPITRSKKTPNLFYLALRPFACFLYPAVFWGFTVGGLWSSWVSVHTFISQQNYL